MQLRVVRRGKSDWRILIWNFGEVEILTCEQKFTSLIAKLPHGRMFLGISHSDNGIWMLNFWIMKIFYISTHWTECASRSLMLRKNCYNNNGSKVLCINIMSIVQWPPPAPPPCLITGFSLLAPSGALHIMMCQSRSRHFVNFQSVQYHSVKSLPIVKINKWN